MDDPDRQVERAEETMDDAIRRLEEDRDQLADHIDDARRDLEGMKQATGGDVAGDWHDTDDASGGEDPEGAHERE
jgi:hypothetical protein